MKKLMLCFTITCSLIPLFAQENEPVAISSTQHAEDVKQDDIRWDQRMEANKQDDIRRQQKLDDAREEDLRRQRRLDEQRAADRRRFDKR